jgi:hypothetical protein
MVLLNFTSAFKYIASLLLAVIGLIPYEAIEDTKPGNSNQGKATDQVSDSIQSSMNFMVQDSIYWVYSLKDLEIQKESGDEYVYCLPDTTVHIVFVNEYGTKQINYEVLVLQE